MIAFRHTRLATGLCLCSLNIFFLAACGSGGAGTTTTPVQPATITSVNVTAGSGNIQPGASQTFQASVTGTGSYSSAVSWSVNGTAGGASSTGTITADGVYTAPLSAPNPNTVTVTATSQADSTKSGSVSLVIGSAAYNISAVQVSPASATITTSASQQFTATVQGTGTFSSGVNWSVNGIQGGSALVGTISSTGLYTAPSTAPQGGSVTIQAASTVAPRVTASAILTIVQVIAPVIQKLSPAVANAGEEIQVVGLGFNASQVESQATVVFTGPNGVQVPAVISGQSTSDTLRYVTVPLAAASGPVFITVTSSATGQTYTSNSIQFQRSPRIRIRTPQVDLSSGESTTLKWKLLAGDGPVALTWAANVGSIASDGTYTAPSGLTSDSAAVVTACVQGTTTCDQLSLALHPFRISPDVPVAASGQSTQLDAMQGSSLLGANWTLNGPGALSTSGLYTASSQISGGGGIPITATSGSVSESGLVEVTGQVPGLVNRIGDYYRSLAAAPYASSYRTYPTAVGVAGNRLYVDSSFSSYSYIPQGASTPASVYPRVVDVYDITDRIHPQWVDAFEPIATGPFSTCGGRLYQYAATDISAGSGSQGTSNYGSGAIGVYDISQASPLPVQKILVPAASQAVSAQSGCVLATLAAPQGAVGSGTFATLTLYAMQDVGVTSSKYSIPFSALPGGAFWDVSSLVSDGKRLYVGMFNESSSSSGYQVAAFDLTAASPTLLGVATQSNIVDRLALAGSDLFSSVDDGTYYPRTEVYDVSGTTPQFLEELAMGRVEDYSGNSVLAETLYAGIRVVDISNPAKPAIKENLFDTTASGYKAVIAGNYAYEAANEAGVRVWDISQRGGMLPTLEAPQWLEKILPAAIAGDTKSVFVASDVGQSAGLLFRYDLTQSPPAQVASVSEEGMHPMALALSGSTLYEGTTTGLLILDASGSGAPSSVSSIAMNVSALATNGNVLLAATGDNHLLVENIALPQSPVQVANLSLPAVAFQIATAGNLALIADGTGGLLVYDISVPSAPQLLSTLQQFPTDYGVAIDGSLALLAGGQYGFAVVDLSNPRNPRILGMGNTASADFNSKLPFSIAFSNKIAYVGIDNRSSAEFPDNGSGMIYAFDYSDPANPRPVSVSSNGIISDFVASLWISGTELFCGCTEAITAFDISQPRSKIGLFPLRNH